MLRGIDRPLAFADAAEAPGKRFRGDVATRGTQVAASNAHDHGILELCATPDSLKHRSDDASYVIALMLDPHTHSRRRVIIGQKNYWQAEQ